MIEDIHTTICAPATASGSGAISVVRVSGPESIAIVNKIFTPKRKCKNLNDLPGYTMCYGSIFDIDGQLLDDVLVTVFRTPYSYTGEDSVEISCHGSNYIVQQILSLLIDNGARMATAGEFSKRAFLNGKMDLAQAEAVADLIASETSAAHRLAVSQMKGGFSNELREMRNQLLEIVSLMELELDFSEEDVQFADREKLSNLLDNCTEHISKLISSFRLGNAIKNGVPVAIVGATNTGKSTLLNALVGEERAIVSSIAGTTRDTIEDVINLDGIRFRFIDTAGIRNTLETIELIGIERTYYKIKQASIVCMMLDATRPEYFEESLMNLSKRINAQNQYVVILINKCDISSVPVTSQSEVQKEENEHSYQHSEQLVEMVSSIAEDIKIKPIAVLPISARSQAGLDNLRSILVDTFKSVKINPDTTLVANLRHYNSLKEAYESLLRAHVSLDEHISTELVSQDIRDALYSIGTIVGEISTDEVLGNIFKNFCIGK